MISVKQAKEKMTAEPQWWKIHFFDFVDDFRGRRNPAAITEPFELSDDQVDALLASTVGSLCGEMSLPKPLWLAEIPACQKPYFVSGVENLKAAAIVESPLPFRIRKVFVLSNFLERI